MSGVVTLSNKPISFVMHRTSAANSTKHPVPIYRGMDAATFKQVENDRKYAAKINSPTWLKRAAEIRESTMSKQHFNYEPGDQPTP